MSAAVYVWSVSVTASPAEALAWLPDAELARAERLRRPLDRRRRLVASLLLHRAVAQIAGCRADRVRVVRRCPRCGPGDHGRPVILGPAGRGIEVSAAHAGDQAMVACAREARVGIDVEQHTDVAFDDVAAVALADCERAGVTTAEGLVRTWTRKEAALKAVGSGLSYPPDRLVVSAPRDAPRILEWVGGPPDPKCGDVALRDLDAAPGYAAAVAVTAPDLTVVQRDGLSLLNAQGAQ